MTNKTYDLAHFHMLLAESMIRMDSERAKIWFIGYTYTTGTLRYSRWASEVYPYLCQVSGRVARHAIG
jgi:hypothetical protein